MTRTMLTKLASTFRSMCSWLQDVQPIAADERIAFCLKLADLEIGTLRTENGEWIFSYSDDFRRQKQIKPIVDFPAVDQEYRSNVLWPFFTLRIPSLKQSAVREFIERNPGNRIDEAMLLREFGNRTIANPFHLVPLMPVNASA